MTIKIERGIPIPPRFCGDQKIDEFYKILDKMNIGDSFYLEDKCASNHRSTQLNVSSKLQNYIRRTKRRTSCELGFITRSVRGTDDKKIGVRIWRTK